MKRRFLILHGDNLLLSVKLIITVKNTNVDFYRLRIAFVASS